MRRAAVLLLALVGPAVAGCLAEAPPHEPLRDPAQGAAPSFAFAPFTIVDPEADGNEPYLSIDREGRLYVAAKRAEHGFPYVGRLWRSDDEGASWRRLDPHPATAPEERGVGGGDAAVVTGPGGEVYFADAWGQSTFVASSTDHGESWFHQPVSQSPLYAYDRPWIAVDGRGRVFVIAKSFGTPTGEFGARSDDGGRTWRPIAPVWTAAEANGLAVVNGPLVVNPATDALHTLFVCGETSLCHATSADGGESWTRSRVAERRAFPANFWPALAADAAGHLYAAWAERDGEGTDVWFSSSPDGETWSAPATLDAAPGTRLFAWVAAGGPGRVAVAWYGTPATGDSRDASAMAAAEWHVHVAASTDANAPSPRWIVTRATARAVHEGTVWNGGVPGGDPPDRSLGEFLTLAVDPEGRLHVAFTVGTRGRGPALVAHAVQAGGPGFLG